MLTVKKKNNALTKLNYSSEITEGGIRDDGNYNSDLFYRNDNTGVLVADPQVIYISDENSSEYGSYYMYGTYATNGIAAFKSEDLEKWIDLTPTKGLALEPSGNAVGSFWAPEVIYDNGKYYMFYSAKDASRSINTLYVAVAENPYGPFQPTGELGTNALFDSAAANTALNLANKTWDCIDASPFVGADGSKYLLFCRADDYDDNCDNVWGMKMNSWTSPDYSTLKRLAKTGYKTATGSEKMSYECNSSGKVNSSRNEGPHMYVRKHADGTATYYLTMSIRGLPDYTVIQAVGTEPLGTFTKLTEEEGGILLANDQLSWDHIQGPGHHCFVQAGEEIFIIYHEQVTRNISEGYNWYRFTAKDRVSFVENANGQEVMVVNGPTWSLQPKVEKYAEYTNIAPEATISADGGSNLSALTDGVLSIYKNVSFVKEFTCSKTVTINLAFSDYREITALQIYNSKTKASSFQTVSRIELEYQSDVYPDGATAYIDDLQFDWNSYQNAITGEMRPGGSAVAVFQPMKVKTIRIVLEVPAGQTDVAVSEIAVLGK